MNLGIILCGITAISLLWLRYGKFTSRAVEVRRNGTKGDKTPTPNVRLLMQCVLTVALSSASVYVILSKQYDEGTKKWASGALGTVVGFWFKN